MRSFIVVLFGVLGACYQTNPALTKNQVVDGIPFYEIEYLNKNADIMHGKKVRTYGFVRAGFDGWHMICSISMSRGTDAIAENIWIADPSCYSEKENNNFREGNASVVGIFHNNQGEAYISGGLYMSQIKNANIEWDRESDNR